MKILMVCLGNICRSPMAEGVLKHKFHQKKIMAEVDSAGTGSWHVGEHPDSRASEVSKKHGIDISKQRARQFTKLDFEEFDKIFAADQEVYNHLFQLAGKNMRHQKKLDLLLNVVKPGSNLPVPDPYFGGENDFELVFQLLDEACEKLASDLL